MHWLRGCGLPNVQLVDGFLIHERDQSVSYQDLSGLYQALAQAVACRGADLTSEEFRFLRKRLGMSQGDAGDLLGYTDQAIAKWEKGQRVPVAAGRLLRATWLAKHARKHLASVIAKMSKPSEYVNHGYVFSFVAGKWNDVSDAYVMRAMRSQAIFETSALIESIKIRSEGSVYAAMAITNRVIVSEAQT